MSAMDIDFDWVSTAYPRAKPLVIISSPPRNTEYMAAAVNRLTTNWANPTPRMRPGPGVMHTKVFVVSPALPTPLQLWMIHSLCPDPY